MIIGLPDSGLLIWEFMEFNGKILNGWQLGSSNQFSHEFTRVLIIAEDCSELCNRFYKIWKIQTL